MRDLRQLEAFFLLLGAHAGELRLRLRLERAVLRRVGRRLVHGLHWPPRLAGAASDRGRGGGGDAGGHDAGEGGLVARGRQVFCQVVEAARHLPR
eukprot:1019585-Prymnesium_polylepis.1